MKPAPKRPAIKPLAAKPKATAKSSAKPNPRKAQDQAELAQVVAQLALSAEKLAQAADRLAEAALRASQAGEQHNQSLETPETPRDETADLATSQQREMVDVPNLTAPETANVGDFTAPGEYPGTPNPPKDE